jgi:hypothetical protein
MAIYSYTHKTDLNLCKKTKRIGIQKYAQTSKIFFCPEIATKGGDRNILFGMPHLRDLTLHTKTKRIGIPKNA